MTESAMRVKKRRQLWYGELRNLYTVSRPKGGVFFSLTDHLQKFLCLKTRVNKVQKISKSDIPCLLLQHLERVSLSDTVFANSRNSGKSWTVFFSCVNIITKHLFRRVLFRAKHIIRYLRCFFSKKSLLTSISYYVLDDAKVELFNWLLIADECGLNNYHIHNENV